MLSCFHNPSVCCPCRFPSSVFLLNSQTLPFLLTLQAVALYHVLPDTQTVHSQCFLPVLAMQGMQALCRKTLQKFYFSVFFSSSCLISPFRLTSLYFYIDWLQNRLIVFPCTATKMHSQIVLPCRFWFYITLGLFWLCPSTSKILQSLHYKTGLSSSHRSGLLSHPRLHPRFSAVRPAAFLRRYNAASQAWRRSGLFCRLHLHRLA